MLKKYDPNTVYKPIAAYHQAIEVPSNARWLVTAGQVGIAPDGKLVQDPESPDRPDLEECRRVAGRC